LLTSIIIGCLVFVVKLLEGFFYLKRREGLLYLIASGDNRSFSDFWLLS